MTTSLFNLCVYVKAKTEQLSNETASLEEQEAGLVHDCVRELQETTNRIGRLHSELAAKSDVIASQNERILELMAKITALEKNAVKVIIYDYCVLGFGLHFCTSMLLTGIL